MRKQILDKLQYLPVSYAPLLSCATCAKSKRNIFLQVKNIKEYPVQVKSGSPFVLSDAADLQPSARSQFVIY